jgi:lysophospholipase L1-like esterase
MFVWLSEKAAVYKLLAVIALAMSTVVSVFSAELGAARNIIDTPPYKMRVSMFDNLTEHRDVVMLGDSITARGEWAELTGYASIANRGIGGDTTAGVLLRLDPIVAMNPRRIFILLGINDLVQGRSVEQLLNNYKEIVKRLHQSGAIVYVQSTLNVSRKSRLKFNDHINTVNDQMRDYCDSTGSCSFININSVLASRGRLGKSYSLDGVHLNGQGYAAWAKMISGYVAGHGRDLD